MTTFLIAAGAVWILLIGFASGVCLAIVAAREPESPRHADPEWADGLRDLDWDVTL